MLFNVFARNYDDHAKIFGFLLDTEKCPLIIELKKQIANV